MTQRLRLYLDLIRWNRPAGWLLLLWPTLSALWLAAGGFPGWHLLLVFTLGTILMRSAGCCINDVADRNFDRHVQRTAQRPVTSGRIAPREALAVGAVLALLALVLVLTTNTAAVLWSCAAFVLAVAYPYAKRYIAMPQAVLGLAFGFGIPVAYAAVQGHVPALAGWLLLGNAFWVLAYDTEYAMVDRQDDLRIGIKTSAITLGQWDVVAVLCFYALYLMLWGWALWPQLNSLIWTAALVLCSVQVIWHITLIRTRSREGCFKAFRLNHWLGFVLFCGVVISLDVRLLSKAI
jgi:4-hydroxybenzoate polyprenyltransferase